MLANLDNEVIFKKAFTNKEIFTGFVKDVLGLDVKIGKIETEKRFDPKIGNIDFRLDIFAESEDERIVIEIQRIEYDHNFDRFLHYFLMTIAELQRTYQTYNIDKEVYGIVVMTAPYTISDKKNKAVRNEVLVSSLNPKNLKGEEISVFNHRLVFLNAYHKDEETPKAIRDWLDLVYQSIHHPQNPQINTANTLIMKAAEIINVDNLTPEERAARKIAESTKVARKLREEYIAKQNIEKGIEEGEVRKAIKIAANCLQKGMTVATTSELMGLSIEEVEEIKQRIT